MPTIAPRINRATVALTLLSLALGCTPSARDADDSAAAADRYAHLLPFDTARVGLVGAHGTTALTVELAESEAQQTMGLMERRTLAPDAGMLFLYAASQPDTSAFWMFRTRLPLDIAFIDSTGVIKTVRTMTPCPTRIVEGWPTYAAGARYRAALEVNAGYFARMRIGVGDRVLLQDTLARRRATGASIDGAALANGLSQ